MLVKINKCSQYHVIVILALALLLGSCSKRVETPYIVIEDFPVDSTLSPLPLPQLDELPGIYDISSVGDYYLCTEKKTDYFFTLYDSDFVRICSFARKGKASGEYIAPVYTGQYFKTEDGTRLHIYDRALQKFDIWQIPSDGSDVELISSFRISNDSTIEIRVLYESLDRTFFGVSDIGDCRFFNADSTFSDIKYFDNVLKFRLTHSVHEISQTSCALSPGWNRVAIGYYNFPQIDIREPRGNIIRTVFIEKILRPEDVDFQQIRDYCLEIEGDKNYIYALWKEPGVAGSTSLLVFDWNGNPVARYGIDKADSFCVGPDNSIVAIDYDKDCMTCSRYILDYGPRKENL